MVSGASTCRNRWPKPNSQVVTILLASADPQGVDAVRLDSWTAHGGLNLHNALSHGLGLLTPTGVRIVR
jgi:hypothetical protein